MNYGKSPSRAAEDESVEADGDVYLALQDAIGKLGSVVVEVPAKPKWCPIRKVLFGLTKTKFPLSVQSAKTLKVDQAPGHHRYRKSVFRHWPLPKINQTGEPALQVTLPGKFMR